MKVHNATIKPQKLTVHSFAIKMNLVQVWSTFIFNNIENSEKGKLLIIKNLFKYTFWSIYIFLLINDVGEVIRILIFQSKLGTSMLSKWTCGVEFIKIKIYDFFSRIYQGTALYTLFRKRNKWFLWLLSYTWMSTHERKTLKKF